MPGAGSGVGSVVFGSVLIIRKTKPLPSFVFSFHPAERGEKKTEGRENRLCRHRPWAGSRKQSSVFVPHDAIWL